VEQQRSHQMVGQNVIGLDRQEPIELLLRFAIAALALVRQGQEEPLVHMGISQEHPTLSAKLVGFSSNLPAPGAAHDPALLAISKESGTTGSAKRRRPLSALILHDGSGERRGPICLLESMTGLVV
jgi:hypothetical protein